MASGSKRTLSGLRVAVTRAAGRSDGLIDGLLARGAEVVHAPLIAIGSPVDPGALEAAARRIESYDWVVFTSLNGVVHFTEALERVGGSVRSFEEVRVASIGPVTAGAALERGIRSDLIPESAVAESLLAALLETTAGGSELAGARILLPVAAAARQVIEDGVLGYGAEVDRVEAYRTVPDPRGIEVLSPLLAAGEIDLLTFASPSAVDHFMDAVGSAYGADVAVIGPITAGAARRRGLRVQVEATEYTGAGLLRALLSYYG
jgi:uroporphyrinogen III methyltransferase/synthase